MEPVFALPGGVETLDRCVICGEPFDPLPHNVARQKTCGKEPCRRAHHLHIKRAARSAGKPPRPSSVVCAVCGVSFPTPSGNLPDTCPGDCRALAKRIRWHRWALGEGIAEGKKMRRETVERRLAELLARCKRPEVFVTEVPPASGERPTGDPWAAPPPEWAGSLPGAVLPIDIVPRLTAPDRLGHAFHGALTALLRRTQGHDSSRPEWSLLLVGSATSSGWAVWLPEERDVEMLRGRTFEAHLRGVPVRMTFGAHAALRLKPPAVTQVGRHRVRMTTITPVCMRGRGAPGRVSCPHTPTIWTALGMVAERIGLRVDDPSRIGVVRVSHATEPVTVTLNPTRNVYTTSWEGDVVLEVNPLARWLLEVASRIGLGGRTAYGLGRIAVRDEPAIREEAPASPAPWEVVIDPAAEKFAARMGCSADEARHAIADMVARASYERSAPNGAEVWRAGDVLLVAEPTTLRQLRVVDVVFEVERRPPIRDHAIDRYAERILRRRVPTAPAAREAMREAVLPLFRRDMDLAYPLAPYRGQMSTEVPDAMLWVGPRTGDARSARLRVVVGTHPGATEPEVLTVLAPLDDYSEAA